MPMMKTSSSAAKIDIALIEAELEGIIDEEKLLDEEILSMVTTQRTDVWVPVQVSQTEMKNDAPDFDNMLTAARSLADQIADSNNLADKVSRMVRQLDEMQMRVQQTLALVEDVINLRECADGVEAALEIDDLVAAAGYVRQYRSIDPAALTGHEHQLQRMRKAESHLKKQTLNNFKKAVEDADVQAIPRQCALLGQLGLGSEAVGGYLEFASRELRAQMAQAVSQAGDNSCKRLSAGFNAVAAFLQGHLLMVMNSLRDANGDIELVRCVHRLAEEHAELCFQSFKDEKHLQTKCQEMQKLQNSAQGKRPDQSWLSDLDTLLDETALVLQHAESYDRFVRHCAEQVQHNHLKGKDARDVEVLEPTTSLNAAASELSGFYSLLEAGLMNSGVTKALEMDTLSSKKSEAEGNISSCVEDAFYVVKRCSTRAMATGHAGSAAAIINHINNTLSTALLETILQQANSKLERLEVGTDLGSQLIGGLKKLGRTAHQDLSSAAHQAIQNIPFGKTQKEKGGLDHSENAIAHAAEHEFAICVNNLEACQRYCLKMRESLLAEVPNVFQEGASANQILACLADFKQTSEQFSRACQYTLDQLHQRLRPLIRTALNDLLGEKSTVDFELDEAAYAQNEATDPWAHKFLQCIETIISPFSTSLCAANFTVFLQMLAEYLVKRIEIELMKKTFTQLGGLQLDKDLRCVTAYYVGKAGRGIKDRFSRLMQISTLLNLDKAEDALEFCENQSSSKKWLLSEEETKKTLALRIEFDTEEVNSLGFYF